MKSDRLNHILLFCLLAVSVGGWKFSEYYIYRQYHINNEQTNNLLTYSFALDADLKGTDIMRPLPDVRSEYIDRRSKQRKGFIELRDSFEIMIYINLVFFALLLATVGIITLKVIRIN
jgi:hypothetical protein